MSRLGLGFLRAAPLHWSDWSASDGQHPDGTFSHLIVFVSCSFERWHIVGQGQIKMQCDFEKNAKQSWVLLTNARTI